MKTAKEFFERLRNDEAFSKEVAAEIQAKRDAGAKSYYETFIPVAAEKGYQVSEEELDEIYEDMASTMSDEELGKVAGGTSCLTALTFVLTASAFYTACETILLSIDELAK